MVVRAQGNGSVTAERRGQSSLFSPTQTRKKCRTDPDALPSLTRYRSGYLLLEAERAEAEQKQAHGAEDNNVQPEIGQMGASEHDGPLQLDVISCRQRRADRVENPGHGLARKNEAGEEH